MRNDKQVHKMRAGTKTRPYEVHKMRAGTKTRSNKNIGRTTVRPYKAKLYSSLFVLIASWAHLDWCTFIYPTAPIPTGFYGK
jgi:hypothetical protein